MIAKLLVVEKDESSLRKVRNSLSKFKNQIKVKGSIADLRETPKMIEEIKPDFIFMNTTFQDFSGFDLIQKIKEPEFETIFLSDDDSQACKAIEMNAIDYLIKPLDGKRLNMTIQKVLEYYHSKLPENDHEKLYEVLLNRTINSRKLAIKESSTINYVDINEIVHLKADGNYTTIKLKDGKQYISSKVLKHYDGILSSYGFLRVHRSNMINLNYVKEFRHRYGGSIVLDNNDEVSIAPDKKKMFLRRFGMM